MNITNTRVNGCGVCGVGAEEEWVDNKVRSIGR